MRFVALLVLMTACFGGGGSEAAVPIPPSMSAIEPNEPIAGSGAPEPISTPPPGAPTPAREPEPTPTPTTPTHDAGNPPGIDASEPDAGFPCALPEDVPWDCHKPTCDGLVIDDTDTQPWNVDHPSWIAYHDTMNIQGTFCLMLTCVDGVPNTTVQVPDGGYRDDDHAVCYQCEDGLAYSQACP